ncbi:hypothetical protein N7541_008134 [Penicillium brevicompactum]|uniref:Uncharacterized protein n=1 Tax=Penicillium brevicompactum TaxID=5074 RepID=A0A9W9QYF0_PENBR|nr:hypothetical protein N7541_008134 [Penicillium brevicompactum]
MSEFWLSWPARSSDKMWSGPWKTEAKVSRCPPSNTKVWRRMTNAKYVMTITRSPTSNQPRTFDSVPGISKTVAAFTTGPVGGDKPGRWPEPVGCASIDPSGDDRGPFAAF